MIQKEVNHGPKETCAITRKEQRGQRKTYLKHLSSNLTKQQNTVDNKPHIKRIRSLLLDRNKTLPTSH